MPGRAAPRALAADPTCEHPAGRRRRPSPPAPPSSPTSSRRPPRSSRRGRRGSAPTTRTPRASPTRSGWRPRGTRSASGWTTTTRSSTRATPARCSSRRTPWRSPATWRRCSSTRTTTRSTAGRRRARWRSRWSPSWRRCSGSPTPRLGHLTVERDDRQPRGAVGRARAAPGQGASCTAPTPTTRTRACARCSACRRTRSPPDADGRIDLDALEAACATRRRRHRRAHRRARPGSAPSTAIDEALALRERYGVRLHVDAAYGGFFTLLERRPLGRALRAIARRDSVVVDPHKHGLQPYGCGAVLFADPRRRAPLRARLAVHLLHVGRAAPRRDQPRVLARRRGGRRRCG